MSGNTFSIEQTKGLLLFLLGIYNKMETALADGEFGWADAGMLASSLMSLPNLVNQLGDLPKEWEDLDAAEAAELEAFVETHTVHTGAKAREVIKVTLAWVADTVARVNEVRALYA